MANLTEKQTFNMLSKPQLDVVYMYSYEDEHYCDYWHIFNVYIYGEYVREVKIGGLAEEPTDNDIGWAWKDAREWEKKKYG